MKPDSWEQLPAPLMNRMLWDCDLDFDHYESSKAEQVHSIECGNISSTNKKICNSYWKAITEELFSIWVDQEIESTERLLGDLKTLSRVQPGA